MDNNSDLKHIFNPHKDDGQHSNHHHQCKMDGKPWYENTDAFDELSKHWNDECHIHNPEFHDHEDHDDCHSCDHDHHEHHHSHSHSHDQHKFKYDPILGPHEHDGFPLHCHDPRPHHCNLPFSHNEPTIPFQDFGNASECPWHEHHEHHIRLKPAYGHVHDEHGHMVMIGNSNFHIIHNDHEHHCHPHSHEHACYEYIRPWSAYDSIGFKSIPQHSKKPISISNSETSKSSEIRDSLGNLRFVVSLASYVPSTGNAFDIKFKDKSFLVDVFSYCYDEQAINIVHEGFYDIEKANSCYEENRHKYELIAKVEVQNTQNIDIYADKINYHQVNECCATCKWAKQIKHEDNLFNDCMEEHFIDGHHMNGDVSDHAMHGDWHDHTVEIDKLKYVCMNRDIFVSSECNGDLFTHEDFSIEPEVMGNCICDKYERRGSDQHCPSSIQHEYDEYGHSIYRFFDRRKKGRIL